MATQITLDTPRKAAFGRIASLQAPHRIADRSLLAVNTFCGNLVREGRDRSQLMGTAPAPYRRKWLEDPASPAIIVGTVDMIVSRLLFEGYGISRKMRPYHFWTRR